MNSTYRDIYKLAFLLRNKLNLKSSTLLLIIAIFVLQNNSSYAQSITDIAKGGVQLISGVEYQQGGEKANRTNTPKFNQIINYGRNDQAWIYKLRALARNRQGKFRIMQIGDSHTAGDYFSDAARRTLQNALGNGGIGWFQPNQIKGNRNAQVAFSGWATNNSRFEKGDFPLGGVITYSAGGGALKISPRREEFQISELRLIARSDNSQTPLQISDANGGLYHLVAERNQTSRWHYFNLQATPPISIVDSNNAWTLGPISIENRKSGISYSSMGIIGAQINEFDKWRPAWIEDLNYSNADLVILAFGTNEAYSNSADVNKISMEWERLVAMVRKALPNAGILIIGAPESLKNTQGECGTRPVHLSQVQMMQEQIAKRNGLLFWSWQQAMGGKCTMKSWINRGLAGKDGVHFSQAGYEAIGEKLGMAILNFAGN